MGLSDLKKSELIALAEENELDSSGTKKDLVARLEPVLEWDEPEAEEVEDAPVAPEEETKAVSAAPVLKTAEDYAHLEDEDFVKAVYLDILGREADPDGLKHYTNNLNFHKNMTRTDLINILRAV
tara:strand:+ start:108 stop:482 length:375 start_codon:yes stop_codon:yes gene_type:complete